MTPTGWKLTRAQELRLEKLFKQAARSSMLLWRNGDSEGYTDLANDMWVWFLERPSTQLKLSDKNNNEIVAMLKNIAIQLLSDEQHKLDLFRQSVLYSSENVKDAMKGKSTNWSLIGLLPEALKTLAGRNQGYADAIESRYAKGVVPEEKSAENKLVRAHKSLTEIVNALCISGTKRDENDKLTVKDGPGSRNGKFPQDGQSETPPPARRGKGEHSDPTANQALSIMKHPEIKEELLKQDPLTECTKRPRQVIFLPDGRRYRMSVEEQRLVTADPSMVFAVIDSVLERVC